MSYDVILRKVGSNKIQVIKVIRQHTGLGLRDIVALVNVVPSTVKADVTKREAEDMVNDLYKVGATAELVNRDPIDKTSRKRRRILFQH
ncbi:MAG: ribosomal protein L7/L12 [Chloroflexaceae bacterium]|nr:ribosomal protein L7/L12 [Chloroflexaceae bacterium]NJO06101.1 ribosomal protein L7/L12 [Chloroflexaceae bacterium]